MESATFFWQFYYLARDRLGPSAGRARGAGRFQLGTGAMIVELDVAF